MPSTSHNPDNPGNRNAWLSGKPDGWYFPLSGQNVNCENPRGKPVSHPYVPDWGGWGGFWPAETPGSKVQVSPMETLKKQQNHE